MIFVIHDRRSGLTLFLIRFPVQTLHHGRAGTSIGSARIIAFNRLACDVAICGGCSVVLLGVVSGLHSTKCFGPEFSAKHLVFHPGANFLFQQALIAQ